MTCAFMAIDPSHPPLIRSTGDTSRACILPARASSEAWVSERAAVGAALQEYHVLTPTQKHPKRQTPRSLWSQFALLRKRRKLRFGRMGTSPVAGHSLCGVSWLKGVQPVVNRLQGPNHSNPQCWVGLSSRCCQPEQVRMPLDPVKQHRMWSNTLNISKPLLF